MHKQKWLKWTTISLWMISLIMLFICLPSIQYTYHLKVGTEQYEKGRHEKAVHELRKAYAVKPTKEARYLLVQSMKKELQQELYDLEKRYEHDFNDEKMIQQKAEKIIQAYDDFPEVAYLTEKAKAIHTQTATKD